jgi:predicted adenine nucleotide alpha hydrolase (AANH) superfamily ATPase
MYWNPVSDKIEEWQPVGGWNSSFSEQEKIQLTNLFFFFKNKKGCKDRKAESLAHMVLFKQKYNGIIYSEEQERQLREALQPVFSS